MNPFSVGLPAWLLCVVIAYIFREKAIGQMAAEQIGKLTLAHRAYRIKLWWAYAAIMGAFMALRFSFPDFINFWFLLFLTLAAGISILFEVKGILLTRAIVTTSAANKLVVSSALSLLGLMSLLGAMAATVFME